MEGHFLLLCHIHVVKPVGLLLLGSLLTQSINQYLFVDYFKNAGALSLMSFLGMIPSMALAPFAVPITRKFGNKEVGSVGCIIGGLAALLLFVIHTDNPMLYIFINIVGYLGFGIFNLIIWAFITDVIDDREV